MKRDNKICAFLSIITVILIIILYVDNVLSESGIPKVVPLVNSLTCPYSEKNELKLGRQDNGRNITLMVGDVILIELDRSGSTGYEWYFDEPYKENFELVKEDIETYTGRGLVGTPVLKKWLLKAIKKGETEIKLYLYRDWEGRDKAADIFTIKVEIR